MSLILHALAAIAALLLAAPLYMLNRRNVKPLHRTRLAKTFQPTVPSLTFTPAASTNNVTLTVPTGYVLNGIPLFTCNGSLPTAAVASNSTVITLAYGFATSGKVFTSDANDPAVRYANGAYLSALTVTL